MKLENQVVSLELAKRLKELGVKQESLFYHYDGGIYFYNEVDFDLNEETNSAFTATELGQILPSFIFNGEERKFLYCYSDDLGFWRVTYSKWGKDGIGVEKDRNEANARALMLILLIQNGIVKP